MSEELEQPQAPRFVTPSGVELQRVYGPMPPHPHPHKGWTQAGEYPFTRGIHPTMYRGRLWTMRQYAGFGTAKETNERFRYLLEHGQTGLSTAFDLPTQMGLDADDPKAAGEVGRVGVHIGTLADMEALFDEIPLGEVSTSLTINATAPVLLAFYVAAAKKQGVKPAGLRGTLQNDILKEFIARGTYIYPVEQSLRLAVDVIEHASKELPSFYPISISGYHIREAGSDAVQEIAFTLANAEVYIQAALDRGLDIDDFAPKLAFFFGCHNHILEEVAKFRAARTLYAALMKGRFKAKDPKSQSLRFHVQTCGSTLTSQQPLNNVMRVAFQAMAAVLGGAQSLHTNAYDEALALPSEEAAQVALRTQQILAHETGVPASVDPVGGSYAIESLTMKLKELAAERLAKLQADGGMLRAIEKGIPQKDIQEAAYRYQQEIESGRRKIVGVNAYQTGSSGKPRPVLKVSPKLEEAQKKSLARFRKDRDGDKSKASLARLSDAARGKANTFPFILESVEAGATLGEICGTLRSTFGEFNAGG
jgi:methylmalonyl-CoA mutase N-terminal domain/subunit